MKLSWEGCWSLGGLRREGMGSRESGGGLRPRRTRCHWRRERIREKWLR
jgi:hypothetical protein